MTTRGRMCWLYQRVLSAGTSMYRLTEATQTQAIILCVDCKFILENESREGQVYRISANHDRRFRFNATKCFDSRDQQPMALRTISGPF